MTKKFLIVRKKLQKNLDIGKDNSFKKIFCLIPARSGSKSIKNKNIIKICNRPLLAWPIIIAKKSKFIKKIVVSTDSKKYGKIAKSYGADDILLRPKYLSKDNSTDFEWVSHAIKEIKDVDIIVNLRPTTPIRNIKVIDSAIELFLNLKLKSLRSVHEMAESSYKTFEIKKNILKPLKNLNLDLNKLNNPRQGFNKTFQANGVIDIYDCNFVTKSKKLFHKKTYAYKTDFAVELDSKQELDYIKFLLKNEK
jgi:CMP-N-acetylneuraminic acid synthetase